MVHTNLYFSEANLKASTMKKIITLALITLISTSIIACSSSDDEDEVQTGASGINKTTTAYPLDNKDQRRLERGKLGGEGGIFGMGGKNTRSVDAVGGVNSYLWRATLDTVSFMPIASADPVGGVIITDWYQSPETKGEKLKLNIIITSSDLRADAVRVSVFKQVNGKDVAVNPEVGTQLEDKILARARDLKINDRRL
jgi:hypothetical protein